MQLEVVDEPENAGARMGFARPQTAIQRVGATVLMAPSYACELAALQRLLALEPGPAQTRLGLAAHRYGIARRPDLSVLEFGG